jgi:hypothetical protein
MMSVAMGNLPVGTTYRTSATRWYDQQLDNSTYDPAYGWYMRREAVTFDMSGAVAVKTTLDVQSTPL